MKKLSDYFHKEKQMAEMYNPLDTSLMGEAEGALGYLRDPRAISFTQATIDMKFDASRRQQLWKYPHGTGDVVAKKLVISADGQSAHLGDYELFAPESETPNIQTISLDGKVRPFSPFPLRDLKPTEKLVLISRSMGGIGEALNWWVRDGEPKVLPPSPTGGSFTDADRAIAMETNRLVKKLVTAAQG